MNKDKNWKNEFIAGIIVGMIVGAITAMLALSSLNIWSLSFSPINDLHALLTTAIIWICFVMVSTLYYKLSRETILKEIGFFIGLAAIIGLINYSYNLLTYGILAYSSLETFRVVILVIIGTIFGFAIIIVAKPKEETNETSQ